MSGKSNSLLQRGICKYEEAKYLIQAQGHFSEKTCLLVQPLINKLILNGASPQYFSHATNGQQTMSAFCSDFKREIKCNGFCFSVTE